jgi:5-methyltetrahydrofolate--homocysteine methyltransferase
MTLMDELSRAVAQLVKERLAAGVPALEIVARMQDGMTEVGRLFESGEYYLSELIMAGEIMKEAMANLEPHLVGGSAEHRGTIVIGTVRGDIHDLGKNIVVMLLKGAGYNVIDLGVDVPPEKFVEALEEHKAPLLAMSVLLTACQESMKDTVRAVKEAGLDAKILVGGNYVDEKVREYCGADYSAMIASEGVKVAGMVFGA